VALFTPRPLPVQRRSSPPLGAAATSNGVGTASVAFAATAVAPFGDGSASVAVTATGAGAWQYAAIGAASFTLAAAATSTNIFPLTISADGRYLKQADGTPFLICGQSVWSLSVNLPIADLTSFLDTITGQGFNTVMSNVIEHFYTVVKAPKERGGALPFTQRMNGTSYTGSPNGTGIASGTHNQFAADAYTSISTQAPDPTFINNTYWTAIETVLNACLARNILIFIWPAYLGFHAQEEGWLNEMVVWDAVTGAGGFTGQSFADPTKTKMWNYGAWLAARWKNYPNIIWMAGGDYGSGTQTLNTAQRNAVTNFVQGMKSVAGQQSVLWSAHWERPCIADDNLITGVTWDLNFCYSDDSTAELCRRGYSTAAKPSLLGEYNYENGLFGGSAPWRKFLWWGFLSGIAGGFFGNEPLWRVDTDYATSLSTQGSNDAKRQFEFLKSKAWHRLKPSGLGGMGTLITVNGGTASPQSTSYVAAACTSEGDLLLAYVPPAHTGSITVDMTKMAATARARWFDPTNATFTNIGAFANTGTQAFTPPASNSAGDADFLLVLETVVGTASFVVNGTAVGAAIVQVPGSATVTVTGQGAGRSLAQAAGAASLALAAAGVSGTVIQGVGSTSLAVTASGVGARQVVAAGAAAIAATAAATLIATAVTSGQAAATFTAAAEGSSIGTGPAVASAALSLAATAVAAAVARSTGAASISLTASALSTAGAAAAPTGFAALVDAMDDIVIDLLG
jgi:hypothetical protein